MAEGGFSERRDAEALQNAWERYERLLAKGVDPEAAAREASRLLTPGAAPLFALADAVRVSARPAEIPRFAARMEADLMAARARMPERTPVRTAVRRRRTAGSTIMAFAACVAVLAGVLVGSSHSLPGDSLYGLKRASEEAQLAVIWGPSEANVRLSLAEERLDEVQGLFARARTQVMGVPGSTVAGALDNMDPRIAQLIRDTLAEAEQQITLAAKILIREHKDSTALDRLATVAHQGASIAKGVAVTLPSADKPPVLTTADNLAIVAAAAEAVSEQVQAASPQPTKTPCPTAPPTPASSPAPSASPSSEPNATTDGPSPSPAATPAPTADPCASPAPSPSATPEPTTTPESPAPKSPPDREKSAQSSPAAQQDRSEAGNSGEQSSGASAAGPQPAS